ncbi:MAG: hypothetical protein LBV12_06710 [Puniceicoccales bacterium]|jgi:hypothetical protein|nr:hypothetical protein [Puniceicoccales bacterium]
MRIKSLIPAIAFTAILGTNLAFADSGEATQPSAAQTEADYEKYAEARIYIKYYKYLSENILTDAERIIDYVSEQKNRTENFFAKTPTVGAPPSWNISPSTFKDAVGQVTRVPNWVPADDQKLFRDGIEQMKKDAGVLQEIATQFKEYYKYNGPYKEDNNKKYAELSPKLTEALDSMKKNHGALQKRILDLASASEKYLAADSALGPILFAMQEDLARIPELIAPVYNPELTKEGNTIAKETADKIEALNKAFKEGFEKNSKINNPDLVENLKKYNERFYKDCADLAKFIDEDIVNRLRTKGQITTSNPSSLRGLASNVTRTYNEFVSYYNYEGGFAIKR